jgi:hypothetical protein
MSRQPKSPTPGQYDTPVPRETTDPRKAAPGQPLAQPETGEPYPQEGIPYPDPDNLPEPGGELQVLALDPGEAVIGSPDFTVHVRGTGFDAGTVIMWNGAPEPTTFVSATELTTVAVGVRNVAGVDSNTLPFTFVAAP